MVAFGHEHDFFGYAVTAISIALNIMLYAAAWRSFGLSFGLSGAWSRAHPNQASSRPLARTMTNSQHVYEVRPRKDRRGN